MRLINKAYIVVSLFIFTQSICLAQQSQSFRGEVNANDINIRYDSTVNSEVICKINKGECVEIILELYNWYKIRLPKLAPSFIRKNLVTLIDDKTAKVLKNNVNIRLHPNESSPILGKVDQNEIINILEDKGGWYKIEPVNNSFGWIHKKFVSKSCAEKISIQEETKAINKIENTKPVEKIEMGEVIATTSLGQSITVEGVINPYGKIFKRKGTHKFISEDNKIFLLKGSKKSLDVLNYHRVKIIGKLVDDPKQKYPIIEVEKTELRD